MNQLLDNKIKVINVGLKSFSDTIKDTDTEVVQVDWQPVGNGNAELAHALARVTNDAKIEEANKKAFNNFLQSRPVLVDIALNASDIIQEMKKQKLILHAGPPIKWSDMCGPMQGAIIGAVILEGWANNENDALKLIEEDQVQFAPNHHYDCVGPMAGIVSPSMPLWVVKDEKFENFSYSNFNEGLGKALRFGAYSEEVLNKLKWIKNTLAPNLKKALTVLEKIEIKPLSAQALHMGDEIHNRNVAASGLLFKKLMTAFVEIDVSKKELKEIIAFLTGNDHFYLNISMASSKVMLKAAENVEKSTMVTVMARNGIEFGIQLSGCSDQWFTAPANFIKGLYFDGYGDDDACRDLGDSAITETSGVGGFAMATSLAITKFVGGTVGDALRNTNNMKKITLGANPAYTLPQLNFTGTPTGIDARLVLDNHIYPIINTGIASKVAGVGQIGAGITTAPVDCFVKAIIEFDKNSQRGKNE